MPADAAMGNPWGSPGKNPRDQGKREKYGRQHHE
jgi:hypothetical protein